MWNRYHVERQWDITNLVVIVSNVFRWPTKSTKVDSMGYSFRCYIMFYVGTATLYLWSGRRCITANQRIRQRQRSGTVLGFYLKKIISSLQIVYKYLNCRTCPMPFSLDRLDLQMLTNCARILQDKMMMTVRMVMKNSPICHWFWYLCHNLCLELATLCIFRLANRTWTTILSNGILH